MIKAAQRLGFTLTEVADLVQIANHRHGARRGRQLRASAVAKIAELDRKITDLRAIRAELAAAVEAADAGRGECSCGPHCPLPLSDLIRT